MKEYSSAFAQASTSAQWSWPLDLDRYDKDPHIHPGEYAELEKRFQNGKQGHIYPHTLAILHRFAEPILDVLSYIDAKPETYHQTLRAMLLEMYRRGTTFWAWSIKEWEESICQNDHQFCLRYGRLGRRTRARRYLPVLAYLLKVHPRLERIVELVEILPLASTVFGQEVVTRALEPPLSILQGWGYSLNQPWLVNACIGYLLLYNGSPHLEHLSFEVLETVSQTCSLTCVQQSLYRISRALWASSPTHCLRLVSCHLSGKVRPMTSLLNGSPRAHIGENTLLHRALNMATTTYSRQAAGSLSIILKSKAQLM